MENLLFVTEVISLKHAIHREFYAEKPALEREEREKEKRNEKIISLRKPATSTWPKLPLELTPTDIMKEVDMHRRASMIYERFVDSRKAEYEINVKWGTRETVREKIDLIKLSNDIRVIYKIYDRCYEEIMFLLKGSFARFRVSTAYRQYVAVHNKEIL